MRIPHHAAYRNFIGQKPLQIGVAELPVAVQNARQVFRVDAEGSSIAVTTPQMVRINDSRFLLIWSEGSNVKYVFPNGNGDKLTDIYSASADLSDCQPVVGDDCVMWYVTRNSAIVMYSISLTAPYALTIG